MVGFVTGIPGCRDRENRFVKEEKRFLDMRFCVIMVVLGHIWKVKLWYQVW